MTQVGKELKNVDHLLSKPETTFEIVYCFLKEKIKCVYYHKVPKFWDIRNLCCNLPKIQTKSQTYVVFFLQNDANEIANSEDPDQTAPLGAVWSGSALFAKTYLSKNLGS